MADGAPSAGQKTEGSQPTVPPDPPGQGRGHGSLTLAKKPRRRLGLGGARWKVGALAILAVFVGAIGLSFLSHGVRWRARLLVGRLAGEYSEIPKANFLRWLRPGSAVDLSPLIENHNVRAAIRNPLSEEDATLGMRVFGDNCARCHGEQGTGAVGPSLVASIRRSDEWSYFATVKWGRPNTLMLPQPLTEQQIWATHIYVRRLLRASDTRAKQTQHLSVNVPAEAIVNSSETSDVWLTYAGGLRGHRHSHLTQISKKNVRDLGLAWTAQFRTTEDSLQGSAIVAGDVLFVPGPPGDIEALDARTGKRLWQFSRPNASDLSLCCGTGNRGVAIVGDRIFIATLDAHLIALEATTGHQQWDVQVANNHDGYTMTSAPLVIGDRVITGVAGGDFGAPGFVAAFSIKDGSRLWQFDTVPGPGQPGHETWAGDSWKTGGSSTWVTGAYDPELGLVYWGVGNPAPIYNAETRGGDNLYSMSAIALDVQTGKLRWYYQFTPADEHDWDSANQPVVADIDWNGTRVPALLWANRNGFFYALDRRTGAFLYAKPFVKQTWAVGFDPKGRPMLNAAARPTPGGTLVWPWVGGATNWQPPSYDPKRDLMFVPAVDTGGLFYSSATPKREPGQMFRAGASREGDDQPATVSVKAISPTTGEARWQADLASGFDVHPTVSGVLSTDGGLVFVGHEQNFLALDADTGKELWRLNLGGGIRAGPIAYAIGGQEFVAVMAGRSLFVLSLPPDER